MRIYFAGGQPKPIKIHRALLFSFYGIKFPEHRYGTKSDFKHYTKLNEDILCNLGREKR